jgi:hypothetical protein
MDHDPEETRPMILDDARWILKTIRNREREVHDRHVLALRAARCCRPRD